MRVENRASVVLGAMSLAAAIGTYSAFNTSTDSGNSVSQFSASAAATAHQIVDILPPAGKKLETQLRSVNKALAVSPAGTLIGLKLRLEQGRDVVAAELKNREWILILQAKQDNASAENEENLSETSASAGGAGIAFTGIFAAFTISLARKPSWY
jgi:hypothetical protein